MPCCAARGAAGAWYLPWLLLASGTAGSRPSNSYALRLAAGWGPAGGPGSRRVATTTTGAGARASGPETGGGGGGGDGDKEAERLLASFVDHEKQGVPKDAGTGASGAFDLGRMRRLLERLGSPERRWPVVHVAGSKGKGSTTAFISSALRTAGYSVGVYTSPHLRSIRERISTHPARCIAPGAFAALVAGNADAVRAAAREEGGRLTHFEVLTALAFKHFADEGVDVAVVETGLGGLTDATNVFAPEQLQAAVITPLGYEHVEALGGSLQSIAAAKAGIFKAGRPVVLAQQPHAEEVMPTLLGEARRLGCLVARAEEQVAVRSRGVQLDDPAGRQAVAPGSGAPPPPPLQRSSAVTEVLDLTIPAADADVASTSAASAAAAAATTELQGVDVQLVGPHQHSNVQTAVATLLQLRRQGWHITEGNIMRGLQAACLPGRFQVLPLLDGFGSLPSSVSPSSPGQAAAAGGSPPGAGYAGQMGGATHVVLDGAHTPESAAALAAAVRAVFPSRPVALVVAMAGDKEHRAVAAALRGMEPRAVVFTQVPIAGSYQRSASPGTLAAQWQAAAILSRARLPRCRELIQASLTAAFEKARHELTAFSGPGVVVVTGSLHAVAEAYKIPGLLPPELQG